MSNVVPLNKYIIAKPILQDEEQKTKSGLILANVQNNDLPRATVVAVSDGVVLQSGDLYKIPVKQGDTVLYGFNCDVPFEHEDQKFVAINLDAIIAVLKYDN